jgi:predicted DNA-binding transcriptional regulator AlpA
MEKIYRSVPKQAKRIDISTASFYRGMKNGTLPQGKKIGGRRVISDAAVDAVMQGGDDER